MQLKSLTKRLLQQSKINDPKYLQEKPTPEEEKYENEFKARLPKNLGHVVGCYKKDTLYTPLDYVLQSNCTA